MPYFIDIHRDMKNVDEQMLAAAHARDLEVQEKHGVQFLKYWYDQSSGTVFCLSEAPSKEAAAAVHREAHGQEAQEIFEVKEGG